MEREQTTIRLTSDFKEEVQQAAEKMGISFNDFVLLAIDYYIQGHSA